MRRAGILAALLAVALAGCGGLKKGGLTPVGEPDKNKPPTDGGDAATVSMKDISFRPETIRLNKGGTITWVNRDKVAHTVTEGDELYNDFNSGDIAAGKSYRRKFNKPGKVAYRCTIHPNMKGAVLVGD